MPLAERNQEVQAFWPCASNEPLTNCVCLGRSDRRVQHPNAHFRNCLVQRPGEDTVSVVDHQPARVFIRQCLAKLLQRPFRRGMCSDIIVTDSACAHFQEHEYIKDSKSSSDDEKIASQNGSRVIPDERQPALTPIRHPTGPSGQDTSRRFLAKHESQVSASTRLQCAPHPKSDYP